MGGRKLESERKSSGTVGKALSVLDQVAAFERPVRFNDIFEKSPSSKAVLYRILENLVTEDDMLSSFIISENPFSGFALWRRGAAFLPEIR